MHMNDFVDFLAYSVGVLVRLSTADVSTIVSMCATGPSISPRMKQSVRQVHVSYLPMCKLFLPKSITTYPVWLSNGMGVCNYTATTI